MSISIASPPHDWNRKGLPGWTYSNKHLFKMEMKKVFSTHWQLVCHSSDLSEPGAYVTFDIGNERAIVVRGKDHVVRAFHNLCRHRGSRVVGDSSGVCKNVLTCPFHGWSYNLDGTLRGASRASTLPKLDPVKWGLKPVETEIWQGFVFIRFKKGKQGSVKSLMQRFDEELAPYELDRLISIGDDFVFAEAEANWKSMRDVDNEGYHVATAHPSLQDLYGKNYVDEPYINAHHAVLDNLMNHPPSNGACAVTGILFHNSTICQNRKMPHGFMSPCSQIRFLDYIQILLYFIRIFRLARNKRYNAAPYTVTQMKPD